MLYAVLKSIHLLALIVWIGGMFFAHFCLRPALGVIDPPLRLRLMNEVLRRFFGVVTVVVALVFLSGLWMLMSAASSGAAAGVGFNMPLDWYVMGVGGVVMMAIFGHIRFVLFTRLQRAVRAQDGPAGAAALGHIRSWVRVNLVLGVAIVVVMRLGAAM
jgi:uncharacterized membrane protein